MGSRQGSYFQPSNQWLVYNRKNKQQIYQSSPQKNISPNYNKPQSDKNWLLLLCIQMYIYLHVVTIVKHIFRIIYFDDT
jgi:hypothetical protein